MCPGDSPRCESVSLRVFLPQPLPRLSPESARVPQRGAPACPRFCAAPTLPGAWPVPAGACGWPACGSLALSARARVARPSGRGVLGPCLPPGVCLAGEGCFNRSSDSGIGEGTLLFVALPAPPGGWAEVGAETLGPSRAVPGRVAGGHLLPAGANGIGRWIRVQRGRKLGWGPEILDDLVQSLSED